MLTNAHENLNFSSGAAARQSPEVSFLFPTSLRSSLRQHHEPEHEYSNMSAEASDLPINPAATDVKPSFQISSHEILSVQSSLQKIIDEICKMHPVFYRIRQPCEEFQLDEIQPIQASMEQRKVQDPSRTSELPKPQVTPRMPRDGSLKEEDNPLKSFIQTELQSVKSSMIAEVQAFKLECLANQESIQKDLEEPSTRDKLTSATFDLEQRRTRDENNGRQGAAMEVTPSIASHVREKKLWADLEEAVVEMDMEHHLYAPVMTRYLFPKSMWHRVFSHFNCSSLLDSEFPSSALAQATEHPLFTLFQTILILANTAIMGYEADVSIKAALQEPAEKVPEWLSSCNITFTIVFALELIFRIFALRTWFLAAPFEWGWNLFDVFVVLISVLVDFTMTGVSLSYIRTLRVLRAVRAARVVRIFRVFVELRRMLFAILASVSSLMWFFLFLTMIVFMVSVLLLQGLVIALEDMPYDSHEGLNQQNCVEQQASKRAQIEEWYGSLSSSMFTLVCAVTGGADWVDLREPLEDAGYLYTAAFLIYVLLVTVAIVNLLTGIFVNCSGDVVDNSMVILNEQMKVDGFVKQMMEIFEELDKAGSGRIAWTRFKEAMKDDRLQAFLSSQGLEPTNARLIFELLDIKKIGSIDIKEFVMGILRLKGEARAIDARTIQRQVSMLPKLLDMHFKAVAGVRNESQDQVFV